MEEFREELTKNVEFLFYGKKYICAGTKIIGKSEGFPKLVITTRTKTIVLVTSQDKENVKILGLTKNFKEIEKSKFTKDELIDEVTSMAKLSELNPIFNFSELDLNREWTEEEDALLKIKVSVRKLSLLLNRGINNINNRKRKLGVWMDNI